jgi:NAD-dependent deacetylase
VADDLRRADQAARQCDLLLAIGSTLAVFPAAEVVNGSPTGMDAIADAVVRGRLGEVLPRLVEPLDRPT